MRSLSPLLLALAFLSTAAHAQADASLKEARERLLKGNYAEAGELYTTLLKNPPLRGPATVGLSRALCSSGEYDQALQALEESLKLSPKDADVLAEKADLLLRRGRWEDAQVAAVAALKSQADQFLAHWVLARLHRDRGDWVQASKELIWFIRAYKSSLDEDKEISDPEKLLLIGQAAVERARHDARLADQFQLVLEDFWGDALKKDKLYWPAHYEIGRLFFDKYDRANSFKRFTKALGINPRAAEVLASKGQTALQRFEMTDAESFCEQALTINPRLVEALCLKADIFLTAGDTQRARAPLEKAQAVNPRSELVLARRAACAFLERRNEDLEKLCAEVEKANPKCWLFYHELGERLDERKRYDAAEKYYRQAMKLRPDRVGIGNQLGLLYMRLGREEEARKILEPAFASDEFNVKVFNTLKVLDHLEKYSTLTTKHFQLRYDPKNDRVLARWMAQYLEEIYAELAKEFQYHPPGPILIEVFNRHQMFSGRVVNLPDLHTIGACTGKMVAMVSPLDQDRIINKPFNWNRVLRHEMVHIFNLEQTKYLCPHWFTEGLAVRAEKQPLTPQWLQLLLERVPARRLHNLDNIHLGFIRPGSPDEWHLAYLQSLLYVEYLIKTHGIQAVGGLLNCYRDGKDTAQALKEVCQVAKEDFEKGYLAYLDEQVKNTAGKPPAKRMTFAELKEKHEKEPDNPDVSAALAEHYFLLRNPQKARSLVDTALEKVRNHPLASYVKARLLQAAGEEPAARELLTKAIDEKAPETKVLKLLGKIQFEAKEFAEAAKTFELGHKAEPYDSQWMKQLVRCYRQSGDNAKLVENLKRLAPTEFDNLEIRRELAQALSKAGNHAEAERYAREALEINVLDEDSRTVLENALQAQTKDDELKQLRKLYEP